MSKKAILTVYLPKNVKEMLFKKYVGERMVSSFIRNLLQRRFFESNVMVCLECGSDKIEVDHRKTERRYRCKDCNNQVMLLCAHEIGDKTK